MRWTSENIYSCCFIGHRRLSESEGILQQLSDTIEMLITQEGVDTFFFGSNSQFNTLCYELVTQSKEKYPHIKRIYVRAEFPIIDDAYKNYLLTRYEDTFFPERIVGAGRAAYVERNFEMINRSRFCIVYYKEDTSGKSGTRIALNYASKKRKHIICFP